uniref:DUF445 domain-containing protein n=1 Tax=uncultured bacterium contig00077 TaxID=1181555 RepID=A0A806KCR5_9BACT|nr:hypothetical protein [uncultured bacterium contig00077]
MVFLIPPVVGAFIGYSTNVVAIKMLFRPLKEARLFGLRLPFTPGILPKQRYRLSQSIGAMVERELLTPQVIRARLAQEDVRIKIKEAISQFTDKIKDNEQLYSSFVSVAVDFLRKREIRLELESKGRIFLRNIFNQLNTMQRLFLAAGQYDITLQEKMPQIIDELISNTESLLKEERIKNIFINAVKENKVKLDDYLFERLISVIDGQMESILASINVKQLVCDRIDSLDMKKVERIILDVMSDQFKWVEIFGGILGFLIGCFQSFFILFLR